MKRLPLVYRSNLTRRRRNLVSFRTRKHRGDEAQYGLFTLRSKSGREIEITGDMLRRTFTAVGGTFTPVQAGR